MSAGCRAGSKCSARTPTTPAGERWYAAVPRGLRFRRKRSERTASCTSSMRWPAASRCSSTPDDSRRCTRLASLRRDRRRPAGPQFSRRSARRRHRLCQRSAARRRHEQLERADRRHRRHAHASLPACATIPNGAPTSARPVDEAGYLPASRMGARSGCSPATPASAPTAAARITRRWSVASRGR